MNKHGKAWMFGRSFSYHCNCRLGVILRKWVPEKVLFSSRLDSDSFFLSLGWVLASEMNENAKEISITNANSGNVFCISRRLKFSAVIWYSWIYILLQFFKANDKFLLSGLLLRRRKKISWYIAFLEFWIFVTAHLLREIPYFFFVFIYSWWNFLLKQGP